MAAGSQPESPRQWAMDDNVRRPLPRPPPGLQVQDPDSPTQRATSSGIKVPLSTCNETPDGQGSPIGVAEFGNWPQPSNQRVRGQSFELADEWCPDILRTTIDEACAALDAGVSPCTVDDCEGGVYLICSKPNLPVGVFKPEDEEPLAPNDKKGRCGGGLGLPGLKHGILTGEAAVREVAAFLLDKDGLAGVPPTAQVTCTAIASAPRSKEEQAPAQPLPKVKKRGSFQKYVQHWLSSGDMSPTRFKTEQVHAIAALDIRLLNTDRHEGNILLKELSAEQTDNQLLLVPIDHGFILPDSINICDFELVWMSWPQAKQPLSEATKQYIEELDMQADVATLQRLGIRPSCIDNMLLATRLLKTGVAAGLNFFEIGMLIYRTQMDEPSPLERMLQGKQQVMASDLEQLVASAVAV